MPIGLQVLHGLIFLLPSNNATKDGLFNDKSIGDCVTWTRIVPLYKVRNHILLLLRVRPFSNILHADMNKASRELDPDAVDSIEVDVIIVDHVKGIRFRQRTTTRTV